MSASDKSSDSHIHHGRLRYKSDVYIDDFYNVEIAELVRVAINSMTELFEDLGLTASPVTNQLPNTQMLVFGI